MTELTLYNGDCLQIMKDISSNSVGLIICDLPYGCLSGRGIGKTAEEKGLWSGASNGCSWDIKIDLEAFWKEVRRIRKDEHTPTIHFCSTKYGYELIHSNPTEFRYDLVWEKPNGVGFLTANKMPLRAHEMIYVFSKAGASYKRIDVKGDFKRGGGGRSAANYLPIGNRPNTSNVDNSGRRCVKSVLRVANPKIKGGHPTQKPEELYRWLIERYSNEGDTILDPTFGSGTSVFTAYKMGRSAIGIEKDEAFFKKAEEKLNAL